ncbi:MAG: hypothetical protein ACF8GE_03565 [Phycisphaerales bacterium JB043]
MRIPIVLALACGLLAPATQAQTILSGTIIVHNDQSDQEDTPPIFDFENGPEFEMEDFGSGADTLTIEGGGGIMLLGNGRVRLIPPTSGNRLRITPSRNGIPLAPTTFAANDLGELEMMRPSPDVDRDGWVTGNDMSLLLEVLWRVCACREDANQDGVIDVEDIRFVGGQMGLEIRGSRWDWE